MEIYKNEIITKYFQNSSSDNFKLKYIKNELKIIQNGNKYKGNLNGKVLEDNVPAIANSNNV